MAKAASLLFEESRGWRLREERFGELQRFLGAAARSGHELRAYDDALDFVAARRDAARRSEVLDRAFPRGVWRGGRLSTAIPYDIVRN